MTIDKTIPFKIKKFDDTDAKAHAILGPSSADRWWNCPGSPAMIQRTGQGKSTYAAAEGTVAHFIASTYLDALTDESPRALEYMPEQWVGVTFEEDGHLITVHADWVDPLNLYINYCLEESAKLDQRYIKTEYRVPLIGGADYDGLEREGTADRVHVHPWKLVHVMDLKWGKGKLVKAFKNLQGLDYLLGVWRKLPPQLTEEITALSITIVQPRHFAAGDGIDTWDLHVSDLIKFEAEVPERVAATKKPDAPIVAGDWCDNSFCPARLQCPAYIAYANSVATAKLQVAGTKIDLPAIIDKTKIIGNNAVGGKIEGLPDPHTLTIEQKELVLERADALKTFIKLVEASLEDDLKQGKPSTKFQLEEGLGNRKFAPTVNDGEILAQGVTEDQLYEKKRVSPTELERRLGKTSAINKRVQENYVIRESTGLKIKPAKDPSKAVNPSDKFNGVTIDVPARVK